MVKYVDEILAAWDKVEPKIDKEGFEKVQSSKEDENKCPSWEPIQGRWWL